MGQNKPALLQLQGGAFRICLHLLLKPAWKVTNRKEKIYVVYMYTWHYVTWFITSQHFIIKSGGMRPLTRNSCPSILASPLGFCSRLIQWCISSGVSLLQWITRLAVMMTKELGLRRSNYVFVFFRETPQYSSGHTTTHNVNQRFIFVEILVRLTDQGCLKHKQSLSVPHQGFPSGRKEDEKSLNVNYWCTILLQWPSFLLLCLIFKRLLLLSQWTQILV